MKKQTGGRPPAPSHADLIAAGNAVDRMIEHSRTAPPVKPVKLTITRDATGARAGNEELSPSALKRYTLIRDGERPLQFDGVVVAEFDSDTSPTRYRLAIYRTPRGRHIAEFSTRLVSRVRVVGTHKKPVRTELLEVQEELVMQVGDTAVWREQKAAEFPGDLRNQSSADALRKLAEQLEVLPLEASQWRALWELDMDSYADDAAGNLESFQQRRSQFIRGHGFGVDESGNAVAFLEAFISELLGDPRFDPKPTGKAAAFDSLDDAVAWFRPGGFTAELLKKLGRWEPEFIE
jgi:hypothetical protein